MTEQMIEPGSTDACPKVSVITTTYNGATYLRETIESILGQTLKSFEYIIIDDRSSDDTVKIIQSYADPRIRFIQNNNNLGISESRNAGFRMARGQYIATTDQDDLSAPDRLERQVRHLEANPDISVAASRVNIIFHGVLQVDPMPIQDHPLLVHFALFFGRHNTTYSSLLFRKSFIVENNLYFRPRYRYAEDYELFSRVVEYGCFSILPESLVSYRKHQSNNSSVHYAEMAANGQAFMRECYERELGRPVSQSESVQIWFGLVEKKPPTNTEELQHLGRLMSEITGRFIERRVQSASMERRVSLLAAQIWNDIVDGAVRSIGIRAELMRGDFPTLTLWRPPVARRARTLVVGAIKRLRNAARR